MIFELTTNAIEGNGEMPEWPIGAVSKTVILSNRDPGFESLSLRKFNLCLRFLIGAFLFSERCHTPLEDDRKRGKTKMEMSDSEWA